MSGFRKHSSKPMKSNEYINLKDQLSDVGKQFMPYTSQSVDVSFQERLLNKEYQEQLIRNLGDRFTLTSIQGENGVNVEPYYDPAVGDMVVPDQSGRVRKVNEAHLAMIKKMEDAIEQKVDRIMEYASVNDEIARTLLGLKAETYNKILKPTTLTVLGTENILDMGEEMAKLDGRVVAIRGLPEGSKEQIAAVSKLRFVCRHFRNNCNIVKMPVKASIGDVKAPELEKNQLSGVDFAGKQIDVLGSTASKVN